LVYFFIGTVCGREKRNGASRLESAKRRTRRPMDADGTERICRRTRIGSKGDEGDSGRIIRIHRKRLNKSGVSQTCFLDDESGPCWVKAMQGLHAGWTNNAKRKGRAVSADGRDVANGSLGN